ncbi:MAG: FtsX-like permease family protein [Synergistaceae bacterium]|jgi:putative ABC transport system permease protein|nr:FtsX-like permease family protein [Synergistaceae bacterium]
MREQTFTPLAIARENLRRKPFRTFCGTALVALLSFVLSSGSLLAYNLLNGISSMSNRLGADAMLAPKGYGQKLEGVVLRGEPSGFYLDGELARRLMETEGISEASAQLFIATMDSSHCAFPVQLIGYAPESDFVIAPWLRESIPSGLGDGEIVIGNSIDGKKGDKIRFYDTDYRVAGRLDKTGMGFDTSIFFNMKTARRALKQYIKYTGAEVPDEDNAVSVVTVNLDKGYDPYKFYGKVRNLFRREGVEVVLSKRLISDISAGLNNLLAVVALLALILWAVAVGVLAILFTATLNERKREFGIYRALGSSRKKLAHVILSESAVISLRGALAGIALSIPFAPMADFALKMPSLRPSAGTAAFILGLCLAASFLTGTLASVYSAVSIGRLATAAILREGE